jgi:hypothetical protein
MMTRPARSASFKIHAPEHDSLCNFTSLHQFMHFGDDVNGDEGYHKHLLILALAVTIELSSGGRALSL